MSEVRSSSGREKEKKVKKGHEVMMIIMMTSSPCIRPDGNRFNDGWTSEAWDKKSSTVPMPPPLGY